MRTLLGLPNLAVVFSRRWSARFTNPGVVVLRSPNRASYLAVLLESSRQWS